MNKCVEVALLKQDMKHCFKVWRDMLSLLEADPTLVDCLTSEQRRDLLEMVQGQWAGYPQLWIQRLQEISRCECGTTLDGLEDSVCGT